MTGLFRGIGQFRVNIVDPYNAPVPPTPDVTVATFTLSDHINVTTAASRQSYHTYAILLGTPFPPRVVERIGFMTTTHEKDGTLLSLPAVMASRGTTNRSVIDDLIASTGTGSGLRAYAVDENTIYMSGQLTGDVEGRSSIIRVCVDADCNQIQESLEVFKSINNTIQRVVATEILYTRVGSPREWVDSILATYQEANVLPENRVSPEEDLCSLGWCPTEEQWCQSDPECSESPYVEPSASLKPGVIAIFVISGFVAAVGVLYCIHLYLQKKQARRFKTVFAKRIAETVNVRGSARSLSPDALANEFRRIDADVEDGKLSKEELWDFVSSGKAGEMDRNDFDALFAAIDLDKNGTVDFLEFCAFMGQCDDEYRAARNDLSSVVATRSSRRLQLPLDVSELNETEADT